LRCRRFSDGLLVAGSAGYIGNHTAKVFLKSGLLPVVLDNLCTGNRSATGFGPFYEGSLADSALVGRLVREHQVESAILFAGHAYVEESTHSPRKYFRNNVADAIQFLDSLLDASVSFVVFSSSCSVYGIQPVAYLSQDDSTNPLSP
jgi:UDP-arabinose 4-epimerase